MARVIGFLVSAGVAGLVAYSMTQSYCVSIAERARRT